MSTGKQRIYYVEDDENIRNLTLYALEQAGFEALGFIRAREFFLACEECTPDLILLDIMLPETDGLEILKRLRALSPPLSKTPVIMLTAKGTEFDTVSGLNAGADDYLAKPFGMMELIARINALFRRVEDKKDTEDDSFVTGELVLSSRTHSITGAGKPISLTLKEFDLLKALMAQKNIVLTRDQLLSEVWGLEYVTVGETRTVDVHIQTLRQKIAEVAPGQEMHIQTVRGVGYCISEDLQRGT